MQEREGNSENPSEHEDFLQKSKLILSKDIRYIRGVGPNLAQYLYKKGVFTVEDLIFFVPKLYENRGNIKKIAELEEGEKAVVIGKIAGKFDVQAGARTLWKFIVEDETGVLECVWFVKTQYIDVFSEGDEVAVFGEAKFFRGTPQFYHPKITKTEKLSRIKVGKIVPVYTISDGVDSSSTARVVRKILEVCGEYIVSAVPRSVEERLGLPDLRTAVLTVHIPEKYARSMDDIQKAKKRLVFEEVFRTQISLFMKRKSVKERKAPQILVSDSLLGYFISTLPFRPTNAQIRAIEEIRKDMSGMRPMYRLLQGDVGSGKTLVAFFSCLMTATAGYQSAVMSPTEILSKQLYENFVKFGGKLGLKIALITGSTKKREREEIARELKEGRINVLVGTHALIYDEDIKFGNLGLVVIDEQHRFGVLQRISLIEKKGEYFPHILVMTATPIPRTVALTVWGDLDISVLDEFPPGKKPVETKVFYESEKRIVWHEMKRELERGGKIFVVYPLLRESEKIDLPSAEKMYEVIQEMFGSWGVGLIHGRMPGDRKTEVIKSFAEGRIRVLVSTTVIEVGIDVPDATMIVIERAERFGLSQIHQLRGRVGRREKEGKCILVIPDRLSENSEHRIRILEKESDGFKIAEADLELRGPGDILGTRQHGYSDFKTEILKDTKIISLAREEAKKLLSDPLYISEGERKFFEKFFEVFLSDKAELVMSG